MVLVAVLLLPLLATLLMVTDRLEDRLLAPVPQRRRHASQRRHLRLIRGGRANADSAAEPGSEPGTAPEPREAGAGVHAVPDAPAEHDAPRHRAA
ncbi:hypothetical protein OG985_08365 [Streptomyces sp. NBC_00289]|uniref:hypothetical protein n=1 Tax=Streptomyces sp. NBC_00289 TaxID=2975703 RepID=UPI00324E936E